MFRKLKIIKFFDIKTLLVVSVIAACALLPLKLKANFLDLAEVNLVDPPLDSVQRTLWNGYPVIIHRRTQEQLISIERLDILKKIKEQSPEILTQQNSAGSNLVQLAAYHDTTLDYLLYFESTKLEHVNNAGYTALKFAVWNEKFENAEKLIKHGATPQGYFYNGSYVPSIYDFMVDELRFTEEAAKGIYKKLIEIEKSVRND